MAHSSPSCTVAIMLLVSLLALPCITVEAAIQRREAQYLPLRKAATSTTAMGTAARAHSKSIHPIRGGLTTGPVNGSAAAKTATVSLTYHGGLLMTSPVNVYFIWYGKWASSSKAILRNLINSAGSSNSLSGTTVRGWFNILLPYSDRTGAKVSPSIRLAGETSDWYSRGKSLSDNQIQAVVASALGTLSTDTNGFYVVLTSSDVTASSGFCTQYCGWHSAASINNAQIVYSFVGNAQRCPSACSAQSVSPNGDVGADGAASILMHELAEAITDSTDGWYDSNGEENGDKCAWKFGSPSSSGGASYNLVGSKGMKFLVQQMWDITSQSCILQGASPTPSAGPVGTVISLFSSTAYNGQAVSFRGPVPQKGCYSVGICSIGSFKIQWNVNDGASNHLGCGRVVLWNQAGCSGSGYYWELPGGWQNWNSNNYNFPDTVTSDLSAAISASWETGVKSISCASYTG